MSIFSGSSALGQVANYSYYTIPAAWILSILPHFHAIGLSKGQFKNTSPRQLLHDLMAKKDKTELDKKIIRAESAQLNGFENLGLFASAVVAANMTGVPNHQLNRLSIGYLASRVLFNLLYIFVTDEATANLRSTSFITGVGIIWTLFIKAGLRSV
ncbi:uncharacterized protein MEPE_00430 [Melanopsichium pennsylvanicum]|uniref:Uncharacterized protein n=2 Tax=Melanopsichium pennsylvanicum TaxID=63383 RepID=A0AAJ4XFX0_9BASI|nr:conserved hypothetical protein [Melanopsichium pennsylvanicum 4]SNX81725.1 uncharacterized protein MEPE_00430 [Melanopsichium pennsylvanicum]